MYDELVNRSSCMALIGLGYVGLPLAIEFSKKFRVIGYDINQTKIKQYANGEDELNITTIHEIKSCNVVFTSDKDKLKEANFYIVAVPTPVDEHNNIDLSMVVEASKTIGENIKKGDMVVYESTVSPGTTEDTCKEILEQKSGLRCGKDFKIGYSPERINPGDKKHTLNNIKKIVSGIDEYTVNEIEKIYNIVVKCGVLKVSDIRTAECIKIIENSQRDVNIAFMNEMAMFLHKMNIDSKEVFSAMKTKWNALDFFPGIVGGHCIGIDSYYLLHKAKEIGLNCNTLQTSRKVNEEIIDYIYSEIMRITAGSEKIRVAVMGITFKEDCSDIRNSKSYDIIKKFVENNVEVIVCDPMANKNEVSKVYHIDLLNMEEIKDVNVIVFAVAHKVFCELKCEQINSMRSLSSDNGFLFDIKSIFNRQNMEKNGWKYWSL